MSDRTDLEGERWIPIDPPPLVMLPGYLGYLVTRIAEGVWQEIRRGTPPDVIEDYLMIRNHYQSTSLEYALWVAVTEWLSCPFVPDPPAEPSTGREPPSPEEGGPSCLIV